MYKLNERYVFDWERIRSKDGYHIEYCITDICNRNCVSCSHLAPLAKSPNFVSIEEFTRVTKTLQKCFPKIHTFWLTGGEPTLHPQVMRLLQIAREIYPKAYIGIYTNAMALENKVFDNEAWRFIKENGIVWGVTTYEASKECLEQLFSQHGCLENLSIVQNGAYFTNLTNYTFDQPISKEKYERCGWERAKINVRNGRIYNCPASEFADLFNGYFGEYLKITKEDYLIVDESLTREMIEKFRAQIPFCGQCNLGSRYKKLFKNTSSERKISEWSEFILTKE